ncbi:MAG TPA: hypothetical protein VFR03_02575 [Thermoanaerobaculia bacterium]|nr:hypothetical protein [Thermoanaerobaculia bacterium]
MKKNHQGRILGRRLARQMSREELAQAAGSAAAAERSADGVSTWTLTYPADGPYNDSGGGGPIYT